jgi:TolB-like protein
MFRTSAFVAVLVFAAWTVIASQASEAPEQPTLLVLPVAAPVGQHGWVGTAIQQDMAVDLTHLTRARVIAPSAPVARDQGEAVQAARHAGAKYVVQATAQVFGEQLRVSGQLTEVATAKVLSPIDATAPLDDLFPLEDVLAVQVARGLPASLANLPAPQTQPAAAAPPPPVASSPDGLPQYESVQSPSPYYYVANGPSADYVYPYPYPYYYGYPYYFGAYWGYGWWGPGVVIVHHGWGYHGWYGYGGHGWAGGHGWEGHPVGASHPQGGMGGGHAGGGMHGR